MFGWAVCCAQASVEHETDFEDFSGDEALKEVSGVPLKQDSPKHDLREDSDAETEAETESQVISARRSSPCTERLRALCGCARETGAEDESDDELELEQLTTAQQLPPALAPEDVDRGVTVRRKSSLLGPVVVDFQAATVLAGAEAQTLWRKPLFDGFDAFAIVLDKMGEGMGKYLSANVTKLRASKASADLESYRDWLLSELPVHKAAGCKGYVDESAWMGNLWISWLLEFFVEMFALLDEGQTVSKSADTAYDQTLSHHHNWMQRAAFRKALKSLPDKQQLYKLLQGDADSPNDVAQDISEFVAIGRPVYRFCLRVNNELDNRLQDEARRR